MSRTGPKVIRPRMTLFLPVDVSMDILGEGVVDSWRVKVRKRDEAVEMGGR